MKFAELIDHVAAVTDMDKSTVKKSVETVFNAIVEAAKRGEEVAIPAFGKFKVKDAPARQGRNPATGEPMEIGASRKMAFSMAKQVKDALAT